MCFMAPSLYYVLQWSGKKNIHVFPGKDQWAPIRNKQSPGAHKTAQETARQFMEVAVRYEFETVNNVPAAVTALYQNF